MPGVKVIKPKVRQLIDFPLQVGESPTWDERTGDLWLVDIMEPSAICLRANGAVEKHVMPATIGCVALCENGTDVLVALQNGVHILNPKTGVLKLLCDPDNGRADSRLNDGKVGPDGCFWIGTRDEATPQTGNARLYRVKPDGSFDTILDGDLKTSNGLAWSPDGRRMYYSDSSGPYVNVFDFKPEVGIAGQPISEKPQRFHEFTPDEGRPDGAAVDADGFYWIAGQGGSRLNRFSPDGEMVEAYLLPAKAPTMPCFGGPDLSTLYITSLSTRDGCAFQHGSLYAFDTEVRGLPTYRFGL